MPTLRTIIEDIQSLASKDRAKVLGCLKNIKELGFNSHRVIFRQVRGKLWEIKINLESGGFRLFYVTLDADSLFMLHSYKKNQSHTINHFYEKLLLLKDRMNTHAAKKIAQKRHHIMQKYLDDFFSEWDF